MIPVKSHCYVMTVGAEFDENVSDHRLQLNINLDYIIYV